jgi:hypothetical protein
MSLRSCAVHVPHLKLARNQQMLRINIKLKGRCDPRLPHLELARDVELLEARLEALLERVGV